MKSKAHHRNKEDCLSEGMIVLLNVFITNEENQAAQAAVHRWDEKIIYMCEEEQCDQEQAETSVKKR